MYDLQDPEFYPLEPAHTQLVWGEYDLIDVLAGGVPRGESLEVFSLRVTAQGDGAFSVVPCGYANLVSRFHNTDYDDSMSLLSDLYHWHVMVFVELDTETRRTCFLEIVSDAERSDEHGYLYVPDHMQHSH